MIDLERGSVRERQRLDRRGSEQRSFPPTAQYEEECSAVWCGVATQCSLVHAGEVLPAEHSTAQYGTAQHSILWRSTAQYSMAQYSTVRAIHRTCYIRSADDAGQIRDWF